MAAVTQQPVSPQWKPHLLMSWLSIFNHTGQLSDDSLKERGEDSKNIIYSAKTQLRGRSIQIISRIRVLSPGQAASPHPPSIQTQRGNKNPPILYVHSSLNFLDGFLRNSTKGPSNWNQMALQCIRAFTLLFVQERYRHRLPKKPDNINNIFRSRWAAARVLPTDGGVQTPAFTHENDQHLQIRNRAIKKNRKVKSCVFKAENLVGKSLINQSYLDNKLTNVATCQREAVLLSKYNIYIKNWGWNGVNYRRNTSQLCYQLRWEILTPRRVSCSDFASLASGCMFDTWNRFAQLEEPAIHFSVSQRC